MKGKLVALLVVPFVLGCEKDKVTPKNVPKEDVPVNSTEIVISSCIKEKIEVFKTDDICTDANVSAYLFQGDTVYTFDKGSCWFDGAATVYNEVCSNLGVLGGYTGNTKINGESFSNAKFLSFVWKQ